MEQVRAHPSDRAATPSEPSPEEVSGKAGIPCAGGFEPREGRSATQCALLNALSQRSGGKARVRFFESVDWKSLTFTGERHRISMVADSRGPLKTMLTGLEDAEFPDLIVADISTNNEITSLGNGQFAVDVEALTIDGDA